MTTILDNQKIEWDESGRPIWVHSCAGRTERVTLPLGREHWQADIKSDTVTPSLWCQACGVHGWWTNGRFWS